MVTRINGKITDLKEPFVTEVCEWGDRLRITVTETDILGGVTTIIARPQRPKGGTYSYELGEGQSKSFGHLWKKLRITRVGKEG